MRDGVPIAVDVYVPRVDGASGARVPAILRMTRYWRAARFRTLVRPLLDEPTPLARRFLAAGYAWLDVDVRGSGASGGVQTFAVVRRRGARRRGARRLDRAPAVVERRGRRARRLLRRDRRGAPARESPPGGARGRAALRALRRLHRHRLPGRRAPRRGSPRHGARFNDAIDRGAARSRVPVLGADLHLGSAAGRRPRRRARSSAPRSSHTPRTSTCTRAALATSFRDDLAPEIGAAHRGLEPVRRAPRPRSRRRGAAVFSYSGWCDGAYAHAAIKRFRTLSNPGQRLLLGPWNHGGDQQLEPLEPTRASEFDHAGELLRFFDLHLKARRGRAEAPRSFRSPGSRPASSAGSHARAGRRPRARRASTWPRTPRSRARRPRRARRQRPLRDRSRERARGDDAAAGAGSRFRPGPSTRDRAARDRHLRCTRPRRSSATSRSRATRSCT